MADHSEGASGLLGAEELAQIRQDAGSRHPDRDIFLDAGDGTRELPDALRAALERISSVLEADRHDRLAIREELAEEQAAFETRLARTLEDLWEQIDNQFAAQRTAVDERVEDLADRVTKAVERPPVDEPNLTQALEDLGAALREQIDKQFAAQRAAVDERVEELADRLTGALERSQVDEAKLAQTLESQGTALKEQIDKQFADQRAVVDEAVEALRAEQAGVAQQVADAATAALGESRNATRAQLDDLAHRLTAAIERPRGDEAKLAQTVESQGAALQDQIALVLERVRASQGDIADLGRMMEKRLQEASSATADRRGEDRAWLEGLHLRELTEIQKVRGDHASASGAVNEKINQIAALLEMTESHLESLVAEDRRQWREELTATLDTLTRAFQSMSADHDHRLQQGFQKLRADLAVVLQRARNNP